MKLNKVGNKKKAFIFLTIQIHFLFLIFIVLRMM
ncbi:hypothetical protein Mgra_00005017 [Meloidogyne graminicola]|uniref:Uncharacterized protein n=1 Tax=Meloidogyne graminicola TaxID=189291 RepID=A0A8S9ZPV0_9BILA|nr:hypothetical protein Mgra_00005017 [Meloidogyne graminicola]